VLRGATFAVRPGAVTAVIGPNGAGKSTALKALSGELRPSAGAARLDGRPLEAWPPRRLAERRAVLPQATRVVFPFTVLEMVRLGSSALAGRADAGEAALDALGAVGLAHLADRPYTAISGGEQRRVDLARALCQLARPGEEARYLLLDEPTASLDPDQQIACLKVARRFAEAGGGVLVVLHDLNLAALVADEIVAVKRGRVAAIGPPAAVLTRDVLLDVFSLDLKPNETPQNGVPFVLPHLAWAIRD